MSTISGKAVKATFIFNGVEVHGVTDFSVFDEAQHVDAEKYAEVEKYIPGTGYTATFTCKMTRHFDWHEDENGVSMMMSRAAHRRLHAQERKRSK